MTHETVMKYTTKKNKKPSNYHLRNRGKEYAEFCGYTKLAEDKYESLGAKYIFTSLELGKHLWRMRNMGIISLDGRKLNFDRIAEVNNIGRS